MFKPLLCCMRLLRKTSAWASGGPVDGKCLAGNKQFGRCTPEKIKHYLLHLNSGNLTLAAIYLRRVQVPGRSFAAALTNLSTVVTLPAHAAQSLCAGLRRPCRGKVCGWGRKTRQMCCGAEQILPALCGQLQVNPRGDVLLTSSRRWRYFCGGANACFNNCYAA
jgi:hypothetical protein